MKRREKLYVSSFILLSTRQDKISPFGVESVLQRLFFNVKGPFKNDAAIDLHKILRSSHPVQLNRIQPSIFQTI